MLAHYALPRQFTKAKVIVVFCVVCLALVMIFSGCTDNGSEITLLLQIRQQLEEVALHGKASVLSNIQQTWQVLAPSQTANGRIYDADINDPAFRIPLVHNRSFAVAIYVRSAHTNRERDVRQGVRETWGQRAIELGMFVVFALGQPSSTTDDEMAALRNESEQYGDLLIFDSFLDHYHNLSLKTHETMRYHEAHRPADPVPSIYVWANSDGFLFPQRLLNYIDGHKVDEHENAIYGRCSCFGECRGYDYENGPMVLRRGLVTDGIGLGRF